jgi:hypothetical protein
MTSFFLSHAHHAQCIEGKYATLLPDVLATIEKVFSIPTRGNPNIWTSFLDIFGIDESRLLTSMQSLGAVGGAKERLYILGFNRATREAQNALLKTFEEPETNAYFFIITPKFNELIPTLRSRMLLAGSGTPSATDSASLFLAMGYSERIAYIRKITKTISDSKDHGPAYELIDGIEYLIAHLPKEKKTDLSYKQAIESVLLCQQLIREHGASVKQLLEHVAFNC